MIDSVQRVMRRGTDGSVVSVAGLPNTTAPALSGDGGLATLARFAYPGALAVGRDGTLYIADTNNARVRAVQTPRLPCPCVRRQPRERVNARTSRRRWGSMRR